MYIILSAIEVYVISCESTIKPATGSYHFDVFHDDALVVCFLLQAPQHLLLLLLLHAPVHDVTLQLRDARFVLCYLQTTRRT